MGRELSFNHVRSRPIADIPLAHPLIHGFRIPGIFANEVFRFR